MTNEPKKACAEALSRVLANTYVLYLKTHNFHWNVEGAKFRALHEMFEEQYRDLWDSLDEMAERIRALGEYAPGTWGQFSQLATIKETAGVPSAEEMLQQLIADHETVVDIIAEAIKTVQDAGDEPSAGLLTDRQTTHEKQVWMMKSMLA